MSPPGKPCRSSNSATATESPTRIANCTGASATVTPLVGSRAGPASPASASTAGTHTARITTRIVCTIAMPRISQSRPSSLASAITCARPPGRAGEDGVDSGPAVHAGEIGDGGERRGNHGEDHRRDAQRPGRKSAQGRGRHHAADGDAETNRAGARKPRRHVDRPPRERRRRRKHHRPRKPRRGKFRCIKQEPAEGPDGGGFGKTGELDAGREGRVHCSASMPRRTRPVKSQGGTTSGGQRNARATQRLFFVRKR